MAIAIVTESAAPNSARLNSPIHPPPNARKDATAARAWRQARLNHDRGASTPGQELRDPGRLSLDECAREDQLSAGRARIGKTSRCAKESLFDDAAKDSITNRRVDTRVVRALEFHGQQLAPPPGAVMSITPLFRRRSLWNSS